MKKILIVLLSLFCANVYSQKNLTTEYVNEIKASFKKDAYTKAITNAITNNRISSLALNRENIGKFDHFFKYKVDVKGITNQKKSGRCWMFTSLNVLRPKVIKKYNLSNFEFSTSYLYFWDIFEKSNLFLEKIISTSTLPYQDREVNMYLRSPVSDGGVWNSFTNLVEKYGVIPKTAMNETYSSENTSAMIAILKKVLRQGAYKIRENKSTKQQSNIKLSTLKDVYKILAINLGVPPTKFNWKYKTKKDSIVEITNLTPLKFLKDITSVNLNSYIMLMDDPTREYGKLYEIESDRNVLEGRNWKYINLPASKIKPFAVKSIKNNEAMYFSCDVGKQLNRTEGLLSVNNYDYESLFNIKFNIDKKARVLTRQSGSSHGMCLVGVDTDDNEVVTKWKLENSWGVKAGHKGYLTMTDKWFDEYMFRVVILDKFIDKDVLKILKQKPTMLKPWDPMFQFDN